MSAKIFVDTNIFVYAHDRNALSKQPVAKALLERLWQEQGGCLSVQVLQEVFVSLTRKLATPLSAVQARAVLEPYTHWRVYAPAANDVLAAIDLQMRTKLSFWDAMVLHSASILGCELLYSEDLNSGQEIAGVRMVNPFVLGP